MSIVWVRSLIEPYLFDNKRTVPQYHSDLSDQSALEIKVRIMVRLKSCTILAFFRENNENEQNYLPRISRKVTSC